MGQAFLDPTVAANYAAATTQTAQLEAVRAPWAGGNVHAWRYGAGDVLLQRVVMGPWTIDSNDPRGLVPGALVSFEAVTPAAAGGTPVAIAYTVYRTADAAIFRSDGVTFAGSAKALCAAYDRDVAFTASDGLPTATDPPLNAYRSQQPYLFQGVTVPHRPSTLGGGGFSADSYWLPTAVYVDSTAGWRWQNTGGDWIDSEDTPQGNVPFSSWAANAVSGSSAVHRYTDIDVTAALQHIQQFSKPPAFILRSNGGARALQGMFGAHPAPVVRVTYTGGATAVLACRVLARSSTGSSLPLVTGDALSLPVFMEIDLPTAPVASAQMDITVTQHWSGNATIGLYVLNPPQNTDPATGADGLASLAGDLDDGIGAVPGVLGAQRYVDGSVATDFIVPGTADYYAEANYSPELWGGAADTNKWPYTVAGKWINPNAVAVPPTLVSSAYTGEGFEPLAPGLGAIKVTMVDSGTPTGGDTGYAGTKACDMMMFLPVDKMGLTDRIFVRFYVRHGEPMAPTPADRREYRQDANIVWADLAGKWAPTPGHPYYYGGAGWNSGGSGGPYGWQMRLAERLCDEGNGGASDGGNTVGWHLYDFQRNPTGYDYGAEGQAPNNWGQRGGLGSTLYAGRWYCVEIEVRLNSVNAEHPTDTGKFYAADGELRAWVDNRLVFERTGMVFRNLPRWEPAYNGAQLRPHRELGASVLWWNWFHGGVTHSSYARTMFMTGLVYGEQRIGPMKMPPPTFAEGTDVGTVPTEGNGWLWVPGRNAEGDVTQASFDALPANTVVRVHDTQLNNLVAALTELTGHPFNRFDVSGDGIRGTFDAWVGCCHDGAQYVFFPRGGGHADNSANGIWRFNLLRMRWEIEKAPSDPYDATFPWSSRYRKGPAPDTGSYTQYIDENGVILDSDGLYWDRLPDDAWTSMHTYNGVWYRPTGRQIGTSRISKWVYSRDTGLLSRERWTMNGEVRVTTIYSDLHYHAGQDAVYGPILVSDFDYGAFKKFAADSAITSNPPKPTGWAVRGVTGVRLDDDRVWWSWQSGGERAAIFNMATETWQELGLVTDGKTVNGFASMNAGVFVPTWGAQGQIIRRGAGDSGIANQWWLYDLATNANLPLTLAGAPPGGGTVYPGNKYLHMPALGLIFFMHEARSLATTEPVIHIMRYT